MNSVYTSLMVTTTTETTHGLNYSTTRVIGATICHLSAHCMLDQCAACIIRRLCV